MYNTWTCAMQMADSPILFQVCQPTHWTRRPSPGLTSPLLDTLVHSLHYTQLGLGGPLDIADPIYMQRQSHLGTITHITITTIITTTLCLQVHVRWSWGIAIIIIITSPRLHRLEAQPLPGLHPSGLTRGTVAAHSPRVIHYQLRAGP
uniref:Uncharacterized protein n=1 Tax=Timema shepardi TaxID=629360 RepID=A0A7R9G7T8_TIMSH|nr:unnamed protein product [Timema shepardi]